MIVDVFFKLFLFFCWFISFSIYNFESYNWGLQGSWVVGLLFILIYSLSTAPSLCKLTNRRFLSVLYLFAIIIFLSLVSYLLQLLDFITTPEPDSIKRSLGHVGYISFYLIVFVSVYKYLSENSKKYYIYIDWFFFKPFIFISIWGLYQWLCTYDVFDYLEIFNNSLSTGFTYLRFVDDHRTSSIFPEPSEYSYYLCLMAPIIWDNFRRSSKEKLWYRIRAIILVVLWLSQAMLVKSLSFVVAIPVMVYVCLRFVEKLSILKTAVTFFAFFSLSIIPIYISMQERLSKASMGEDGSVDDRFIGFIYGLDFFFSSPLFGAGYGSFRGMDQVSFLIGCFGIFGTFLFFYVFLCYLKQVKNANPVFYGSLISFIAASLLSNNTMDHVFTWVFLAFFAAYNPHMLTQKNNLTFLNRV